MPRKIKKVLKKILPSHVFRFVASYRYGFFGPYQNWDEAKKRSIGYDSDVILDKVKNSLLKVKRGEAVYERDSVLFDRVEYSWPLLASLLMAAKDNGNKLNVIDFGGSLGSSYFQNKGILGHLESLHWNIVEQENFVACGKKNFADEYLHFYNSIEECLAEQKSTAIIFSSSIEYLEKPYEILKEAMSGNFQYIIFDRTTINDGDDDFVTLQKVPPQVYSASYPCWFLSEKKLRNFFSVKYDLLADFGALGGTIKQHAVKGEYKGMIFRIKK